MMLQYTAITSWPPLAWLAELETAGTSIRVHHGPWVETTDQWFCEAAWAGNFPDGDFDETDIVAGSGGRVRGDTVTFVASGSNLDRLHVFRTPDGALVSNSLCCLLARVKGSADLGYLEYTHDFASYRYSIFGNYSRVFPSTAGPIEITYFANLGWDGRRLAEIEKPHTIHAFGGFAEYRAFLSRSMKLMARNAASSRRARPFKLLCSISKGYDSPAVAVLAAEVADRRAARHHVRRPREVVEAAEDAPRRVGGGGDDGGLVGAWHGSRTRRLSVAAGRRRRSARRRLELRRRTRR